jgi:hypothetical protein
MSECSAPRERDKRMQVVAAVTIDADNERHCSLRCPQLSGRGYEDPGFRCALKPDRALGSNFGKPYRHGLCLDNATPVSTGETR